MFSHNVKRIIKYGVVGSVGLGTVLSLHSNNYDINSIGVVRLGRAALTVFDISLNYQRNLYSHKLDKASQEYADLKSICHKQAAEKLLNLCCTNKGVYIKVGQHLAALDYLLPHEFVKTMRVLHSHAPSTNLEDVQKVIREELGKKANEIFVSIDPEPVGTASLAQVHRATLHDGTVVAVKVQHPYVKGNSKVDMRTMEILVKLVSLIFPDFKFQWLVDETKKNLPRELDFTQEGRNAERLAAMYTKKCDWLKIPTIMWDLTTPRVLTMEYVDGGQVNDVQYIRQQGINPHEVSDKLGALYSDMIFTDGFVHSDPHPGNILVRKSPRTGQCDIVLLDHGLYAELSREFRTEYAKLWLSILNVDRNAMRLQCTRLGIQPELYGLFTCMLTGRSWDTVLAGVDRSGPSKSEKALMRKELPNVLPQISGILDTVDRQMLLVLKTNDLLRGIEYSLGTYNKMSSFKVMSHRCIRTVYRDKIRTAEGATRRFAVAVAQYWALFKFTLYYTVMNIFSNCGKSQAFQQISSS